MPFQPGGGFSAASQVSSPRQRVIYTLLKFCDLWRHCPSHIWTSARACSPREPHQYPGAVVSSLHAFGAPRVGVRSSAVYWFRLAGVVLLQQRFQPSGAAQREMSEETCSCCLCFHLELWRPLSSRLYGWLLRSERRERLIWLRHYITLKRFLTFMIEFERV